MFRSIHNSHKLNKYAYLAILLFSDKKDAPKKQKLYMKYSKENLENAVKSVKDGFRIPCSQLQPPFEQLHSRSQEE
jgi:hypothetical protein